MLETKWYQNKPTEQEILHMWKTIKFIPFSMDNKVIADMVTRINNILLNGGCIFKSFQVTEDKVFDWFASRNRLNEFGFFKEFFTSNEVIAELSEYSIGHIYLERLDKFEWGNSYTLDGELANLLVIGGAYERFKGTPKEAKDIGFRFCKELYDERYEEVVIFKSHVAWSDWFMEIAWDTTWVMLDKRNRVIHLMCVTETD